MKRFKRYLAGILTASMVASAITVPAFADEKSNEVITTVEHVTYNKKDNKGIVTVFYANGNPVTVEAVGETTYVHLDTDTRNDDSSWVEVKAAEGDTITAIVAGGKTGDTPNGKITMESGTVTYLIGSSSGNTDGTVSNYKVGNTEITVTGGEVEFIYTNRSVNSGNGAFTKNSEQHVGTAAVTVGGTATVYNVYGCFGYTSIDDLKITIKDNAKVVRSILPGATNGKLGACSLTVDGAGVEIGEIAGCQRTLVDSLEMNLKSGTVKGAITAGAIYNDGETYDGYWKNQAGIGNVHYGVVKDTKIQIGKDFKYNGIYAGFQFMEDEVKKFYEKFKNITGNTAEIMAAYGITAAGEIDGTVEITVENEPNANASGSYTYLGNKKAALGPAKYKDVVPNLLTDKVKGVTVTSAPKEIAINTDRVNLNVRDAKEVVAKVTMMAPVATQSNAIQWKSDNDSVASVEPSEDGKTAVITGHDIGATTVTASYTENGKTVEDAIGVSVGGDFNINVSPSGIKMGDTITFVATASGSNARRAVKATASDADYNWSISDDTIARELRATAKKLTAKAVGAGNATVDLNYTDAEGTTSEGHAAFSVEAPQIELTAPDSVELGKKFKLASKVTNIKGTAEELGISTAFDVNGDVFVQIEDTDEYIAVELPGQDEQAFVIASAKYPSNNANNIVEAQKTVSVIKPTLSGEAIYLNTGDEKSKTVKLPATVKNILTYAGSLDIVSQDPELADVDYDEDGNMTVTTDGQAAGNTTIDIILPLSEEVLVSYPVVVIDTAENAEAKDGGSEVLVPSADDIPTPELPAEIEDEELKEQFDRRVEIVKESIIELAMNRAVVDNNNAVQNLGDLVAANGLLADGEKARVSLKQELKSVELETIVEKDAEGNIISITVAPKKLVFDISALKTLLDQNGEQITGTEDALDLSKDNIQKRTVFKFRLPVPATVDKAYANVEHEGDGITQYPIEGEGDQKYIVASAWHLSEFAVTFTDEKMYKSYGGGSGTAAKKTSNGSWLQDSNGWWFRLNDGSYPKNQWYECTWNGVTSWYHFNTEGYMDDGWFNDVDGRTYFLHNISDNTRGRMYTGWNWIDGKCYYFETVKGNYIGHLYRNTTTPDNYTVNENGEWTVNGVVQTR